MSEPGNAVWDPNRVPDKIATTQTIEPDAKEREYA